MGFVAGLAVVDLPSDVLLLDGPYVYLIVGRKRVDMFDSESDHSADLFHD